MPKTRVILASLLFAITRLGWSAENTLCESTEQMLWSCNAGKKTYSVCAFPSLSRSAGYLQYRVGTSAKAEFVYPAERVNPLGKFIMTMGPHGASLEFINGRFKYSIAEEARGLPLIFVDKDDQQVAAVRCKEATGGLLENKTLDFMRAAGVLR